MNKYYVISFVIHLTLFFLLKEHLKKENKLAPSIESTLPIQWMGFGNSANLSKKQSSRKKSHRAKKVALEQKLISILHPGLAQQLLTPALHSTLGYESDGDFDADGSGEYFQNVAELPRYMDKVWRKIRAEIYYKRDFIAQRIEGAVSTKILIAPDGHLLVHYEDELQGKQEFVTQVVGALQVALAEPFLSPPLKSDTVVYLKFIFKVIDGPTEGFDPQKQMNHLLFPIYGTPPPTELRYGGFKLLKIPISTSLTAEQNVHDFYRSMEHYEFACFEQKNSEGCKLSIHNYKTAGFLGKAERVATKACAIGINEFCKI